MDNRRRMMWKKPPEYAIYYTSTDGNIVTPYSSAAWGGANIISNTYENGEGKIVFDKKVTSLYNSFKNCKTLKTITIPEHTFIGYETFRGCTSLTSVTIPNSVTSIGDYAFYECTSLTNVVIPDSITSIGVSAFYYCTSLTNVVIPDSVTEIRSLAFSGCTSLTSVTIPNSVTKIGNNAFRGCSSMTSVTIPNSVTSIGDSAFYDWDSLTSITIPDSVTTIEAHAFASCDSLTSVTIGNSVTEIRSSAFYNCSSLKNITIPDSVTSIGTEAFYKCTSLTSFYGKFSSEDKCCLIVDGRLIAFAPACGKTSYIITDSVTSIENRVFSHYTSLTSVTIPDSVTSIALEAFYNCTSLTSITIPDSVTSIGVGAFSSCSSLTSVTIGNGVTSIGEQAFMSCKSLTSVTIPDSVTSIGRSAFNNCSSITSLTIGSEVTSIEDYAFYCSKLKNINSLNPIAPTITSKSFYNVASSGVLTHPINSDYSSWMQTSASYLGYYNWTSQWPYTPQTYYDLSITAQDVIGNLTTTTISWTCMSDGIDTMTGETITGIQLSGTVISEEFPQNTSETETVERIITFEYQGLTASTTITQGVWLNLYYELVLNDNWQLSTAVANPDSALYDGVYESFSNYNVGSTAAIMYIDIFGYETFQLYIRSYAESSYDYVMVSQIDQTINNSTSYSNTTLVKAHTRGTQKSGTTISDYKLVEFTGLDGGEHRITVVYRKDGSGNSGTDKGYLIIPRQ